MNKLIKSTILASGALCAVKGFDNRLQTTYYNIKSNKIPKKFNNFKIVHLSDFHSDYVPGLSEAIRIVKPDLILCTGDMVDDEGVYDPVVDFISEIKNVAPIYLITGNHDIWRSDFLCFEKEINKSGAFFLRNKQVELCHENESIIITGIDDPFVKNEKGIIENINLSLTKLKKTDKYNIGLFHRANHVDKLSDCGFDLILTGHMHGGQIRIPYLGGVLSPRSNCISNQKMIFPSHTGGVYKMNNTPVIVSRGLGNPMIIPRIFNRPEMIVIKLKHSNK